MSNIDLNSHLKKELCLSQIDFLQLRKEGKNDKNTRIQKWLRSFFSKKNNYTTMYCIISGSCRVTLVVAFGHFSQILGGDGDLCLLKSWVAVTFTVLFLKTDNFSQNKDTTFTSY